jgi:hypothetical protein
VAKYLDGEGLDLGCVYQKVNDEIFIFEPFNKSDHITTAKRPAGFTVSVSF